MKYCCKICGRLNSADNWIAGRLKCNNCEQLIKSVDNAVCIGQFIDERYELKKLLEQRTNTNIYIAFDLFNHCHVLLRLYFWNFTYSVTSSEKFLEIAQSVSFLAQPQHLKIIECGQTNDGMIYTIWPYENIESLSKLLQVNGSLEVDTALNIFLDVAIGLDKVYQETGLGHYNLNTNKIYLNNYGEVRISDLGQAAFLLNDDHFSNEESDYFNERFLAPEIILDEQRPNIHSDMFSLGACLYFTLTGNRPFENLEYVDVEDYQALKLSKAHELKAGRETISLLYRLLDINPENRYEDWQGIIDAIRKCLNHIPGGNAISKRARLTTKFDCDFILETQIEELEEPELLNARAISLKLETNRPQRSPQKRKQNKKSPLILISAAVLFLTGVLISIHLSRHDLPARNHSASIFDEKLNFEKPKDRVILNFSDKSKSTSTKSQDNTSIKQFTTIDIEVETLRRMKVKPPEDTPRNIFQEHKFKIRELALMKQFDKALQSIDKYRGPYTNENQALRQEVIRRRNGLEKAISQKNKEPLFGDFLFAADKHIKKNRLIIDTDEAKRYIKFINSLTKLRFKIAIDELEALQKEFNIDLSFFLEVINLFSADKLRKNIASGYKDDFGKKIKLKLKKSYVKGVMLFFNSETSEITFKLEHNKKKVVSVDDIHYSENYLRINNSDSEIEGLLKVLYLLQNNDYEMALSTLYKDYHGPLRDLFIDFIDKNKP